MPETKHSPARKLLLGVDTCGPTGTVALGEIVDGKLRILGQTELAGRTYSATLVSAVADLLAQARTELGLLHAMLVVNGPGSFTGVRVGLSAVKGLAEVSDAIAVVAVSRLEVLAAKAKMPSAALDAHRGEVFLRILAPGGESRELLAGPHEFSLIKPAPAKIAVCDNSAAALLAAAWPIAYLVRISAPTAADALSLCVPRILKGERADLALLDGHYLRRSDAEIFGDPAAAEPRRA